MPQTLPASTGRTPWTRLASLCAASVLVCGWYVSPVVNFRHLSTALYWGDVRLNTWALAWNHRVLTGQAPAYWDANIFHPALQTLAFSEHLFGIAVPTLPLHLMGAPPALVYNIAWLASFPLVVFGVFCLARRAGVGGAGALAAGLLSACSIVRIQHVGHLQLLWIFGLPLGMACLDRWRTDPRVCWLVAWVLCTLTVSLASWYLAVLTLVVHVVWVGPCLWPALRRRDWPRLLAAAIAGAVVAAVLLVFAQPYMGAGSGPVDEMRHNSADWASYLVPARATWSGQWLLARGSEAPRWSFGEQTRFLGWTVLLLASFGASVAVRRNPRLRRDVWIALGAVGGVALALSFGPGAEGSAPWPFDALRAAPGLGLVRAPARFALVVSLVVAVFAGLGVDELVRGRRRVLAAGAIVFALLELRPVAYELPPPEPAVISPLYGHVARLARAPVVSLPVAWHGPLPWYDADYGWYSTRHWFPIVNGFSRILPTGYADRMAALAAFPADVALDALCAVGTRYVIAHAQRPFADFRPALAAARGEPRLRVIARDGEDVLWELDCRSGAG